MPPLDDTRSPAGSTSSKRGHRDDDHYERGRKDDGRGHRHRSRTRSPDRRYRDRDSRYHRDRSRDRSRDRYRDHDAYRSSRRDRSRERRRPHERGGLKDDRRRSRDRDSRPYRDDSRDRARRSGDNSKERGHKSETKRHQEDASVQSGASTVQSDEAKKAERLARAAAWKQKLSAGKEKKLNTLESSVLPRNILAEIDEKENKANGFKAGLLQPLPTEALPENPPDSGSDDESPEDVVMDGVVDPLDEFMTGLETVGNTKPRAKINPRQPSPDDPWGEDFAADLAPSEAQEFIITKPKKKDIPTVDHNTIVYEPFRKHFYNEPDNHVTDEEAADLRHEAGIKIKGAGHMPKPVEKWSQLGLSTLLMNVIDSLGYEKPSPIQSQAMPAIMSGKDVIGIAKTGSGKTLAFLLPMFRHIMDQRPLQSQEGPIGLILAPTRELATQIHRECKPFLKACDLRAVCAYGGAPIKDQIADFKRGASIVVATPGRLLEILAANSGRVTNLRRVTYLTMDEADRLFDLGFEPQIMKLIKNIRPDRQTVLFSATFPRAMQSLAAKALVNPVEILVGGKSVVAPEIEQIVEVRPEETKFTRLLELLGNLYELDSNEDARTLVFVEKQESCDNLMVSLLRKGYPCSTLHGGKDQIDRDSTIADFKAGVIPVLIATSIAARGLDVQQLRLVLNYDTPNHLEDYIHRVGRTGRAGNKGTAVTFITPDQDRYSIGIAKALRDSKQEIPPDLAKLVDSFNEKVKLGKEKASGSGFGGKGLERLDQERDAARARERKTHKTGDEPDEDEDDDKGKDEKGDDLITKAASSVQAASAPAPAPAPVPVSLPGVPKGIDLDGKIVVHKTEVPADGTKNPLDKVGRAVANIHDRLSKNKELRQGVPIDNKGPDAGAFHATLEINDFPQKARWAVTNRTNVAKILEATGTSITTKGNYYIAGTEPKEGDQAKLYILVEGDTEVVVTNAMRELMRLLKEGTMAAADSDARAPASGRYTVV